MNSKKYQKQALRTESTDFSKISKKLDKRKIRLLHAAMGLQTESAEFTDMLKKHLFYGKELDVINLQEELFDITWYIAIALDELGYSFEEGFDKNIAKLKARFPDKFDELLSEKRNLQKERKVLES